MSSDERDTRIDVDEGEHDNTTSPSTHDAVAQRWLRGDSSNHRAGIDEQVETFLRGIAATNPFFLSELHDRVMAEASRSSAPQQPNTDNTMRQRYRSLYTGIVLGFDFAATETDRTAGEIGTLLLESRRSVNAAISRALGEVPTSELAGPNPPDDPLEKIIFEVENATNPNVQLNLLAQRVANGSDLLNPLDVIRGATIAYNLKTIRATRPDGAPRPRGRRRQQTTP